MPKRKFKGTYLLFFLIPLAYYLLLQRDNSNSSVVPGTDYFYFSAKSSKPAIINLNTRNQFLASWQLNTGGYKFLDFLGSMRDTTGIVLTINNLNENDTISFLAFNLFRNNQVFSLFDRIKADAVFSNAKVTEEDGVLTAVIQKSNTPFSITMRSSTSWENEDTKGDFKFFIGFIFIVIFILLLILEPPVMYFVFTCLITISVMLLTSWWVSDSVGSFEMKTTSPVKRTEMFFNHYPQFAPLKRFSTDSAGHSFKAEIDIKSNKFLRLDVENTPELNKLKLKVRYGLFSKTWNIGKIEMGKLVVNDLIIKNGNIIVCGNDPFIALTSNYFFDDINWLLLLKRNTFLFISLFVFIALMGINVWVVRYVNLQFKSVYLFFFLLPVAYTFLFQNTTKETFKKHKDYLYYSVKTTKPAIITLFAGLDSVTSWNVNSSGFKLIDCVCNLKDADGLTLKIKNLSVNDTASFLAFNFFRNNTLCSLYDRSNPYCNVQNASAINKDGVFSVVARQTGSPLIIKLIKTDLWQKMQKEKRPSSLVILVFILAFMALLIMAPPTKYFVLSCLLTLLLMGIFSWLGKDIQDQVTMCTSTPQRSVESYFSKSPVFNIDDKFPSKSFKYFFRTQVELGKNQYIRCDVDDSLKQLNNFNIAVKTGLFKKEWDFTKIPLGKMVINDVSYHNGTFIICGNDPFFALTSTFFVDPVNQLVDMRYNVFLFIALFLFVFLVTIHKFTAPLNSKSFFLFVFFLTLIANGFLFKPFNSDRVRLMSEKRNADTLPVFNFDSIKSYTRQLNNYLNDQVTGRNNIIPFNNYIYYSLFGQLLNNPEVYFGKDGWMFYVGANGRETYENREPITQSELYKIKYLFEERRDWLKERGIKLYIIFPRISQFIYEEKLGSRMFRYNKISKLEQLMSFLKANSDLDIIDVGTPLLEAKKETKAALYYKSSTHWNYYGAYFAYKAMINHINKDFPAVGEPIPLEKITWNCSVDMKKDVDLIEMAALIGYARGYELLPKNPDIYAGDTVEHNFPKGKPDFPTLYIVNKKKQSPNLLMFRDSYARQLYPYLSHHFNRSAYLWTNTFDKDLVEDDKPDMVIWEMSERFIPFYVIYKNPPFPKLDLINQHAKKRFLSPSDIPYLTFKDYWMGRDTIQ